MQINLPWPPSNNTYYRHNRGRTHISAYGQAYRAEVWLMCRQQLGTPIRPFAGRLAVTIVANQPDKRRRDIDNVCKGVFDSLTHAGIWYDDSQVHWLAIEWGETRKPGGLVVTINEMGAAA